jgi:hypothetical protein
MSASITEVKHLLQSKAERISEAVLLTASIEFFLAAIIPQLGSHAFRGQTTVIGFSGGEYIQFFSPVYRISYRPRENSATKKHKRHKDH